VDDDRRVPRDVTLILRDFTSNQARAAAELLPIVYAELRALAGAQMARLRPGQTLQPTALVHEAYLKLVGAADPGWNGRGHFFGAAAQAMRELLVDHIRRKAAVKRGGGQVREDLDVDLAAGADGLPAEEVLAIHEGLQGLEAEHPRKAEVVVMRFFGGLSVEEIAAALGTTTRTVERDLRFARAYLYDRMGGAQPA
jgi:RNA polymerase sigma factor (TIGR02999 family)